MGTPFKMKGFSGFGNSPLHQDEKTNEIKEHVLFKDPAIPSVEHSEITYSPKSGLQISGHGSKTGDVTESGTSKTGKKTNIWRKSGKRRSAEYILNNPE
jgi:hypothetical protein